MRKRMNRHWNLERAPTNLPSPQMKPLYPTIQEINASLSLEVGTTLKNDADNASILVALERLEVQPDEDAQGEEIGSISSVGEDYDTELQVHPRDLVFEWDSGAQNGSYNPAPNAVQSPQIIFEESSDDSSHDSQCSQTESQPSRQNVTMIASHYRAGQEYTQRPYSDDTVRSDLQLARALQEVEDEYAYGIQEERVRQRRVLELLERLPAVVAGNEIGQKGEIYKYDAPDALGEDDALARPTHFRLFTDALQSADGDVCVICHEELAFDVVVSLRCCNHIFHLNCIDDALKHSKRCPTCRRDIRVPSAGRAPSGSMTVSWQPTSIPTNFSDGGTERPSKVIQIEYSIPDGYQKKYHEYPGQLYRGTFKLAYLPDSQEGKVLLHRLIYAFLHGHTFRICNYSSSSSGRHGKKSFVRWASIPHVCTLGDRMADSIYMATCHAALDELGIPPASW